MKRQQEDYLNSFSISKKFWVISLHRPKITKHRSQVKIVQSTDHRPDVLCKKLCFFVIKALLKMKYNLEEHIFGYHESYVAFQNTLQCSERMGDWNVTQTIEFFHLIL